MLPPVALALGALRVASNLALAHQLNRLLGRALLAQRLPPPLADRRAGPAADAALADAERELLEATVAADVEHRFVEVPPPDFALFGEGVAAAKGGGGGGGGEESKLLMHTLVVTPRKPARPAGAASPEPLLFPATPPRTPLVLLHGHGMSAAFWCRNFDGFLAQGYDALLAPDLLGWGRSSRPIFPAGAGADAGLCFFLDALDAWLDAVLPPGAPFALAGHSLGGHVAHELAARHADRITRLVLVSPAAILRHIPLAHGIKYALTPQRFLHHGGAAALLAFAAAFPDTACYNLPGMRRLMLYTNALCCGSGDAAAASFVHFEAEETSLLSPPPPSPRKPRKKPPPHTGSVARAPLRRFARRLFVALSLRRLRAECVRPLLDRVARVAYRVELVAGDCDELVNIGAVRALHRAMLAAGSPCKLAVVHGGDHAPMMSAPDTFARALLRGAPIAERGRGRRR